VELTIFDLKPGENPFEALDPLVAEGLQLIVNCKCR
jgi:hypothetical protein